ncbi:MAG: glycosyltransferase [Salinivirgaceae bacterium]|nr:glycosyltransferase [Salinivirgaceae bacterium]
MNFFSVVIPLYNKEKSIKKTIESVLNQSFKDLEVIIVNDASTDNSLKVVESIKDDRIRVITKENGGVSDARNRGILEAKGDYIAFLDADDFWDTKYLLIMNKLINDFNDAFIFSCQFGYLNNNDISLANSIHKKRGYIDNYFFEANKAPLIHTSSVIIKKSCFEIIGLFNTQYKRGEDVEMWCRLSENFKHAFEPTLLSYYVLYSENSACQTVVPLEYFFLEYNLFSFSKYKREYFAKRAYIIVSELLKNKQYRDFFRLIIKFNFSNIIILYYILLHLKNKYLK